jgi:hypothetical protein
MMNRFLYVFLALILSLSCSEQDDSTQVKNGQSADQSVDQKIPSADQMWMNADAAADAADAAVPVASFKSIFENYLKPNCAQDACHGGSKGVANLTLTDLQTAYDQLINVQPTNTNARDQGLMRVSPNDPEKSFLWQKITGSPETLTANGWGAVMPTSSIALAGPHTKEIIQAWIKAGAPMAGTDLTDFDSVSNDMANHYTQCQATDEEGMKNCFEPPKFPDRSVRIYTPPLVIPPNTDTLVCSYLSVPLDRTIKVNQTIGQQMKGGHHSAVFLSLSPSMEPPHPCRDQEMSNFRFAISAGGGGGQDAKLPNGIAISIPQGQQLVIQSHYLNATNEPITVMDAVDLITIPEADVIEQVDPFAVIYSDLAIPAHTENFEVRKLCRLEEDLQVYMLLGHTHSYGVLFEIYYHSDSLAEPRKLYYATDGHLLKDNPEIKYFDPPLPFKAGDQIEVRCVWTNDTDHEIGWPEEMCVALMYYGPGQGWMTCDVGDDVPNLNSGNEMPAETCVAPDALGNEIGVGKACTPTGGECQNNNRAGACLALFDASANFCSFIGCQDDMECGSGAVCHMTACVPVECAQ